LLRNLMWEPYRFSHSPSFRRATPIAAVRRAIAPCSYVRWHAGTAVLL